MIEIGLLVTSFTFAYWLGVRVGQEGAESGDELDARYTELQELRDEITRLRDKLNSLRCFTA